MDKMFIVYKFYVVHGSKFKFITPSKDKILTENIETKSKTCWIYSTFEPKIVGKGKPITPVLEIALSSCHRKCIESATTLEAVGWSGYLPCEPATSKWVYFKGLSEDSWWSVKPEPLNKNSFNLSDT